MIDPPAVRATNLTFGYPRESVFLGPISLELPKAATSVILGPNGAGKSTLCRLIAGLLKPASGQVNLGGLPMQNMGTLNRARTIAFLPQNLSAPQGLTCREIAVLGRHPRRQSRFWDSVTDLKTAEEAMILTQTIQFAERPISTLSAGEQRRVHLAAAIAQQPQILILDEPTAYLDPLHQLQLLELISAMRHDRGVTVIFVTHDLNIAARYGDQLALIHRGRLAAVGQANEVLRPDVLAAVYGVDFEWIAGRDVGRSWIAPLRRTMESATCNVPD